MNQLYKRSCALVRRKLGIGVLDPKALLHRNFCQETSGIKDEWWSVDGQVVRIRDGQLIRKKEEYELVSNPKPMNLKKLRLDRTKRAAETKIKDRKTQTFFWNCYLKNYQHARAEWEKLSYEGPPNEQVAVNFNVHVDHYKVLGLERRNEPFSLDQLKNAFRRKAKLYHPQFTGKSTAFAATKFRQLFNSYKHLSAQKNRM